MPFGLWVVVGWMAFVTLSAFVLLAWGLRTHQFDDVEEPKYTMLEDQEPQDWPGRKPTHGSENHA